jgi:hypothetical protein
MARISRQKFKGSRYEEADYAGPPEDTNAIPPHLVLVSQVPRVTNHAEIKSSHPHRESNDWLAVKPNLKGGLSACLFYIIVVS